MSDAGCDGTIGGSPPQGGWLGASRTNVAVQVRLIDLRATGFFVVRLGLRAFVTA
jgi:hypothetical protein